jgi:FixJ family two-component response regulator
MIIVTGSGNEEIVIKAMKMGAYDYLIKDPESNVNVSFVLQASY